MDTAAKVEGATVELVLLSKEEIKKGQDSIRKRLLNLDSDIHANAVQCMLHCSIHRDTSLMRRLLVDIVDDNTGYRRQGLIAWMRHFSPMNLAGKEINLAGKDAKGHEKPFMVSEANALPFWKLTREVAIVKPVYRDTLFAPINTAMKNFHNSLENTVFTNGVPSAIDPTKPFFDGIGHENVVDFFEKVKELQAALPKDSTREVRQAQEAIRKAVGDDEQAKAAIKAAIA